MKRFLPYALIFLVAACRLTAGRALAEEMGIVAVVNDEPITQSELDRAMAPLYFQLAADHSPEALAKKLPQLRAKTLEQLMEEKLMLQEAEHPHPVEVAKGKIGVPPVITVSDLEVEEMISETQSRFASAEEFTRALAERGLTLEDLKTRYRVQVTVEKLIDREIRSRVVISPSEVTAYYHTHAQEFEAPQAVQGAVILIRPKDPADVSRAKELAQDLRKQIAGGADFYELASRYSDGPNAKMGGRVGFIEKGKTLQEIDQVLFTLQAGEISPVISTAMGFNIFKVESIRPVRRLTLEEAQGMIQRFLQQEKSADRYKEWMARLKANAYISIK